MPKKTTATKKATKKKTKAAKAAVSIPGPRADRPVAKGYGLKDPKDGLLPWSWAEEQLAKSRTYWISTARSDGRPHTMPVWGAWVEGAFWFGTGEGTQKARIGLARSAEPGEVVVDEVCHLSTMPAAAMSGVPVGWAERRRGRRIVLATDPLGDRTSTA